MQRHKNLRYNLLQHEYFPSQHCISILSSIAQHQKALSFVETETR